MRVTQKTMYDGFTYNMNKNLSAYMESNIQGSSQKRINRPSDDPVGMSRVLSYRASIARNEQYEDNSGAAYTWLSSTDSALTRAQTVLANVRDLAEQASTGTITSENRAQIASQLRQAFGSLLNLANTEYVGQHLFAGHKTGSPAFQEGLGISTTDSNMLNALRNDGTTAQVPWEVSGSAPHSIIVRFDKVNGDTSFNGEPVEGEIGVDEIEYSYSKDGGDTWETGTIGAGEYVLDLDGAQITFPEPGYDPSELVDPVKITVHGNDGTVSRDDGTMLVVRPTAYYQGDNSDLPPLVDNYGTSYLDSVNAHGSFDGDVRIRLDSDADVSRDGKLAYSYSLDNGITWQSAKPADTRNGASVVRLAIPGGYLDVEPAAGQMLDEGQQFVVRPRRSDQGYEINTNEFMDTVNCGKDIFGGLYTKAGEKVPTVAGKSSENIFETISNLIAWVENGVQDGAQEALPNIESSMEALLTDIAKVGGKRNRVDLNLSMLQSTHDDMDMRTSALEDIDITVLMNKLAMQQMAYQTVLQSSSMIMNLNLTKFI